MQPSALVTLLNIDTTILYGKRQFDSFVHAYRYEVLTGIRPGELIGLQHKNIKGSKIELRRSVNRYNEITEGKNQNAIRNYVMSEMAEEELRKQILLLPPKTNNDSIFGITSLSSYENRWKRYREVNKLGDITLYELRHTFISMVKELPEAQVKALVGHSINMDTFGVYGHEVEGESEKIASAVNDIFTKIVAKKSGKDG